jgi:biofilm PGA synthesis N-glycosyltransferase PgaC
MTQEMQLGVHDFSSALAAFCFGYPFVMSWYWMAGGLLLRFVRDRKEPRPGVPPPLANYPLVSVLIPCFNEERQAGETFAALAALDYPAFEIIAINDGSSDNTGAILDAFTLQIPQLRVVHLAGNQGKSTAMNAGALMARGEILVGIDGDALLDPHALTWMVRRFQMDASLGALTGNPRVRNRVSLLGKLQVGEFSSIVGLIKRAQSTYGTLFTVSGVICAFRKCALQEAGWWSAAALTDDVDVTWRIQLAGWRVTFEPKALCWILTPETLDGLWRQRLRWAEGGLQAIGEATGAMVRLRRLRLVPIWTNYVVSIAWAYAMLAGILLWVVSSLFPVWTGGPLGFSLLPKWWGVLLAMTYFLQSAVSVQLDRRFEDNMLDSLFWVIWYPLVFWMLQATAAVVGVPRALALQRSARGRWVSPDRGMR